MSRPGHGRLYSWHGRLAHASQGHRGPALGARARGGPDRQVSRQRFGIPGRVGRRTHGQDARVTHGRDAHATGFTLVELLTALAIVAIVLPAVVQGVILCLDLSVHARMQAQAASLAQMKLSELAATRMIDQSVRSGDFGQQWPQYVWIATTESWYDARLVELDVSVFWVRKGKEYDVTVSTLVYDDQSTLTGDSTLLDE